MTTKEYLGKIRRYDRMISNKLEEIQNFRNLATTISTNTGSERVQASRNKDKLGSYVSKIVDMEREVDDMIDQRYEIVKQIESLDDSRMYDALAQRFILGKELKSIKLDGIYSEKHTKRIFYNAIGAFAEKYKDLYAEKVGNVP